MNQNLSSTDITALSPLLILLIGSLVMLLVESFAKINLKRFYALLCLAFIGIAIVAAIAAPTSTNNLLTPWLNFDQMARFFTLFFLVIGLVFVLLSIPFFKRFEASQGEYYFLLLAALFGLILIGASADFLTLFLGIEILALSLYVFCGYMKAWQSSSEAAIKYFLMGALATAFLLYGIALVYGAVGTTRFDALLNGYKNITSDQNRIIFLSGIAFITLGLSFEAAVVPFQVWAPDVYAGAPTPVTAFMAVGTKVGAFAAFVRVFFYALPQFDTLWNQGLALLVYPTLIYANFVALRQVQLRRFFAYSGISHAGFLLIPFVAGTPDALSAVLFYLVVYALATSGAFAVLSFLEVNSEGVMLDDLRGLFKKSPVLAAILTICLLTLAGIPPTAGFFAKFYIFKIAFQAGYYGLVIVGLLTTVLSVFYYLRIIGVMFSGTPAESEAAPVRSWSAGSVGICAAIVIIIISCYPQPLINLLFA